MLKIVGIIAPQLSHILKGHSCIRGCIVVKRTNPTMTKNPQYGPRFSIESSRDTVVDEEIQNFLVKYPSGDSLDTLSDSLMVS